MFRTDASGKAHTFGEIRWRWLKELRCALTSHPFSAWQRTGRVVTMTGNGIATTTLRFARQCERCGQTEHREFDREAPTAASQQRPARRFAKGMKR